MQGAVLGKPHHRLGVIVALGPPHSVHSLLPRILLSLEQERSCSELVLIGGGITVGSALLEVFRARELLVVDGARRSNC